MQQVGTVGALWRYPVKGMAGESVDVAEVGAHGLAHDRILALRDTARQEIQSCKTRPGLLRCQARWRGEGRVEITWPDGSISYSDDADVPERLAALTGRESTLEALRPADDLAFYARHRPDADSWLRELEATFEREAGEPLPPFLQGPREAISTSVGVPGTFFLVTPLHLLTTATLRHLRALRPASDWDERRFRANLVIDTAPGIEGLVEQAWIGHRLHIGALVLDLVDTTVRCGAITREGPGLPSDPGMLRTVVLEADQNVGIYGSTVQAAMVRVGDPVLLD
jgi:uncharacterized protein